MKIKLILGRTSYNELSKRYQTTVYETSRIIDEVFAVVFGKLYSSQKREQ